MQEIISDLLTADSDVICHQVNLQGVMGGGIALSIAKKYPKVNQAYIDFPNKELGEVCFVQTNDFVVANCFSQNANFDTNYEFLKQCLVKVNQYMNDHQLTTVSIPYKYGCGIANGDWNIVLKIFEDTFKDKTLKVYKLSK